mgnify:CR=1 FL=1
MKKKVLIIGLDGARADATRIASTPHIDSLIDHGCVSWNAQTEMRTVSGPAWTSLLTGCHTKKHGVDGNSKMDKKRRVPTIFKLLKDWNPDIKLVAHSHWKPIITQIIERDVLNSYSAGSDKKMAKNMARDINAGNGDVYFVQLDEIDAAGHMYGYSVESKRYIKKIQRNDKLVGTMVSAIENRPFDEEWLVCLVSDHGGNGKSHGGLSLGELTIIFMLSGNAISQKGEIPDNVETSPRIVDVVPSIAKFIGMPPRDNWDGKPRCMD